MGRRRLHGLFSLFLCILLLAGCSSAEETTTTPVVSAPVVTDTPSQNVIRPEECWPVIIIPGIMGTELSYQGTVWPPFQIMELFQISKPEDILRLASSVAEKLNLLKLTDKGLSQFDITPVSHSPVEPVTQEKIVSIGTFDTYRVLADTLAEQVGYENVYFFGYDWRLDCRENGERLREYIELVCQKTGKKQVQLVAHSMGGLVASCYLEAHKADGRIQTAVTLGTPFWGSEKAVGFLNKEAKLQDFWSDLDILQLFPSLTVFLNGAEALLQTPLYALAESMPSLYELLPVSAFRRLGLTDDSGGLRTDRYAAEQGWAFYQNITSRLEDVWRDVPHVNVAGTGVNTPADSGANADGDGTVTRESATAGTLFQSVTQFVAASHQGLVTDQESLSYLLTALLTPAAGA